MAKKLRRYAEGTDVDPEKSESDVKRLLKAHGASGILMAEDKGKSTLIFRLSGRMLKYELRYPDPKDHKMSPGGRYRNGAAIFSSQEAEWRRRWRALFLILKAKLEIVYSGDSTLDQEFMADIMLPNGETVGEVMLPRLQAAYDDGQMPPLLLPSGD